MPLAAPQEPHAEVLHQAQEPAKVPDRERSACGVLSKGKAWGAF